jgi:hypothetical protein
VVKVYGGWWLFRVSWLSGEFCANKKGLLQGQCIKATEHKLVQYVRSCILQRTVKSGDVSVGVDDVVLSRKIQEK